MSQKKKSQKLHIFLKLENRLSKLKSNFLKYHKFKPKRKKKNWWKKIMDFFKIMRTQKIIFKLKQNKNNYRTCYTIQYKDQKWIQTLSQFCRTKIIQVLLDKQINKQYSASFNKKKHLEYQHRSRFWNNHKISPKLSIIISFLTNYLKAKRTVLKNTNQNTRKVIWSI